jgi:Tol biopolymer transport system component
MHRPAKFILLAGVCAIACGGVGVAWAGQQSHLRRPVPPPRPAPTRDAARGAVEPTLTARAPADTGAGLAPPPRIPTGGFTERVSTALGGTAGDGFSFSWILGLSQDGRYVSFDSEASNLVPGDTNRLYDTFVRDRLTNKTELVSVGLGGVPAEDNVFPDPQSYLSGDGRFVAFGSLASNLVPGDKSFFDGGRIDVFVRDRKTQTTERVSVSSGGEAGNGHSSAFGGISADGRFVAFVSTSTNLVTGYGGSYRLFLRDRKLGLTEPVCVASQDAPLPNFGECFGCGISADGRFVAFTMYDSPDYNGHLFVRDREKHLTQRVSATPGSFGYCPWNALSVSGRYLMYFPYDPDDPTLAGLFVRDLWHGTDERVAFNAAGEEPNDYYNPTHISADGRLIVFDSPATNLIANDTNGLTDVFVLDRATRAARLVSVGPGGRQSDGPSEYASISANGRVVAFRSDATNLLPRDDGNPWTDIFVHFMGGNQ